MSERIVEKKRKGAEGEAGEIEKGKY